MTLGALVLTLLFGGLVGVASGLVGVGGGILMVPYLYLLFALPELSGVRVPPESEAVVAHATSLFVIIPTALSGLRTYHRSSLVAWDVVLPIAGGAVAAAALGARAAISLPPDALKAGFGLLLLAGGTRLLFAGQGGDGGSPDAGLRTGPVRTIGAGLVVGFFSALMGVGGGIVAIPILIYVVGLEMRKVAATSIGVVAFAATAGVAAYLFAGRSVTGLTPGTTGYIFLPAGLAMIPGAVVGARRGALLNQRLNVTALRLTFAFLFLIVGLRLALVNGSRILG